MGVKFTNVITVNNDLVERAEEIGGLISSEDDGFEVFYRGSDGEEALVISYNSETDTTMIVSVYASTHHEPTTVKIPGGWSEYERSHSTAE